MSMLRSVFINLSDIIYDGVIFAKIVDGCKALTIFAEKVLSTPLLFP